MRTCDNGRAMIVHAVPVIPFASAATCSPCMACPVGRAGCMLGPACIACPCMHDRNSSTSGTGTQFTPHRGECSRARDSQQLCTLRDKCTNRTHEVAVFQAHYHGRFNCGGVVPPTAASLGFRPGLWPWSLALTQCGEKISWGDGIDFRTQHSACCHALTTPCLLVGQDAVRIEDTARKVCSADRRSKR